MSSGEPFDPPVDLENNTEHKDAAWSFRSVARAEEYDQRRLLLALFQA